MNAQLLLALVVCLTLGLAPFTPEPHLVKQAMNIVNGNPMGLMDFVDILVHGAPFAWLGYLLFKRS